MAANKVTVSNDKVNALVQFVSEFNAEKNRGCPAQAIRYVGGFSNAEIKAAKDQGLIKGTLGPEGGFFPADAKPVPKKEQKGTSLKSRMADFIRQFVDSDDVASSLIADYDAEIEKRKALSATK